jgi:hypothetical protein
MAVRRFEIISDVTEVEPLAALFVIWRVCASGTAVDAGAR